MAHGRWLTPASFVSALLLFTATAPSQSHVADFTANTSGLPQTPLGLSRRAYSWPPADRAKNDEANYALTDWILHFFDGRCNVINTHTNSGGENYCCADVGIGIGDTGPSGHMPRPLVAGGAFSSSVATSAGGPGFGPYALPLSMEAVLEDWSQFLDATVYNGSAPEGLANGKWKGIGVTLLVDNLESGNEVERLVTVGIHSVIGNSSSLKFDVYKHTEGNALDSIAVGGPVTVSGLTAGSDWKMKINVASNKLELFVANGSNGYGETPKVKSQQWVLGTPGTAWNIVRVKAATVRVCGLYTITSPRTPLAIRKITANSSSILAYPPTGSTTLVSSSKPMLRRFGGDLIADGAFEAPGTNVPLLLNLFAGLDAPRAYGEYVLDQLADPISNSNTDRRVVRFAVSEVNSRYLNYFGGTWPGTNYPMLDLFFSQTNHDKFFDSFDALVNAASSRGITLVPCLLWDPRVFYAYTSKNFTFTGAASATVQAGGTGYSNGDTLTLVGGTGTAATFTATVSGGAVTSVALLSAGSYSTAPTSPVSTTGGTGTGCTLNVTYAPTAVTQEAVTGARVQQTFGFSTPDPIATQAAINWQTFVADIVGHYKNHPTILFWEVGNEWDNYLDATKNCLTLPSSVVQCWDSPAMLGQALDIVAQNIITAESGSTQRHLIGSGFAGAAAYWRGFTPAPPGTCNLTLCETSAVASVQTALRNSYPESIDLVSLHPYANGGSACSGGEPPSPFPVTGTTLADGWDELFKFMHDESQNLFPSQSSYHDRARPVYVGEVNWHWDNSTWQNPFGSSTIPSADLANLTALLTAISNPAGGKGPRAALTLTWEWMSVPHYRFKGTPSTSNYVETLASTAIAGTASHELENFAGSISAPRIQSAGFSDLGPPVVGAYVMSGQTSVPMQITVQDAQGDCTSVSVVGLNGLSVTPSLTTSDHRTWSGTLSFASQSAGAQLAVKVTATDAKGHTSLTSWPFSTQGGSPPSGPLFTLSSLVASGATCPKVISAGFYGFERVSSEGGPVYLTAQFVDHQTPPNPIRQSTTYKAFLYRFYNDTSPSPWATLLIYDDGPAGGHGDGVADDAIWTGRIDIRASTSSSTNAIEIAVSSSAGPPALWSDAWPRIIVH